MGDDLAWERIALTEGQVHAHNLPKIPKEDKRFLGNVGLREAVETEALSQRAITAIVRNALERLLPAPLGQVLAPEEAERQALESELRAIDSVSFCRGGNRSQRTGIIRKALNYRRGDESRS